MRSLLQRAACLALLLLPPAGTPLLADGPEAREPAPAPSLLLVTLDTTRADRLGCYGAVGTPTPVLDRLAREGVRFARALSPTPLTLPSHATLLTGRPPRLHGVRDNALFRLEPREETLAEVLSKAGYRTVAVIGAAVLDRSTGIDQGFDVFDDQVRVGSHDWFAWKERAASQVTDVALELAGAGKDPLFLWVHYYDPHLPYVPPEPYFSRMGGRAYDGEIAFMDAELGRLLAGLEKQDPGRSYLVAVAGDHGEGLGDHGEAAHGVFVYQATQWVPLILRGPDLPAGRTVAERVGLVDLAPSLLDLLGLPALPEATGRSFLPLVRGEKWAAPDYELESLYPAVAFAWVPPRALVRGRYKYIEAPIPELYDLEDDPAEQNNLAPSRRSIVKRLRRDLIERFGEDIFGVLPPWPPDTASAEHVNLLLSLGYVTGSVPNQGGRLDPKEGIALVADLDRARVLLSESDPAAAVALLEPLLGRNPGNLPALLTLGNAYLAAGETDQAIRIHRIAVKLNPAWHLTHFNLAQTLRAAGDDAALHAEAQTAFREALALHPRHAESYRALARMLAEKGSLPGAREVLVEAEAREVTDPALSLLRGAVEASLGNRDEAEKAFRQALVLDPGLAEAHAALGRLAYIRGQTAQAAASYHRALDLAPSPALARTLGSILLHDLGDLPGAYEAFLLALTLDPDAPEAATLQELITTLEETMAEQEPDPGATGETPPQGERAP